MHDTGSSDLDKIKAAEEICRGLGLIGGRRIQASQAEDSPNFLRYRIPHLGPF
jgi:hypothetical protein